MQTFARVAVLLFSNMLYGTGTGTCAIATSLDIPYNFTLAALNLTDSSESGFMGAPLVLGYNGASTGVQFKVTSTFGSYPYDDYPYLALRHRSLIAFDPLGEWVGNATALSEQYSFLEWIVTREPRFGAPAAEIYTVEGDEEDEDFPELAVYGRKDLWSLCPDYSFRGQTSVVFNVSAAQELRYKVEDCYSVAIQVLRTRLGSVDTPEVAEGREGDHGL